MKYDLLSIGHISLDYNVDFTGHQVIEVGGAVIYSSAAAYASGIHNGVVTKVAPKDRERLKEFVIPVEDIFYIPSASSTSIMNQYHTADKERRTCTCICQADSFRLEDIPSVDCDVYHLAGLIYGDYADGLIEALSKRGKVAVDVQTMLRHADGDGKEMYFADWKDKIRLLPYVHYLKTDAAEAEILTGQSDRYRAAEILFGWGAKEIVITHNTEVLCYDGNELHTCPIRARSLKGRSGRGDTTFAAYLAKRPTMDCKDALLWATATVSHKMENVGPYRGNELTIKNYIDEFYGDIKTKGDKR